MLECYEAAVATILSGRERPVWAHVHSRAPLNSPLMFDAMLLKCKKAADLGANKAVYLIHRQSLKAPAHVESGQNPPPLRSSQLSQGAQV